MIGFLKKYINKFFCLFFLFVYCIFEIILKVNFFIFLLEVDKKIMNWVSFYVFLYNKLFYIFVF